MHNSIAAWPRWGETNPRNTIMYSEVERRGYKVYDMKNKPWTFLFAKFIHVHWPEKAFKNNLKMYTFLGFVFLVKLLSSKKILWTLHNDPRSEIKNRQSLNLFVIFMNCVDLFLLPSKNSLNVLKEMGVTNYSWALLPLGLYPKKKVTIKNAGYNLIFGRLTQKKDIYNSILQFCNDFPFQPFFVAGMPENEEMKYRIKQLNERFSNLEVELGFIEDERLHQLVASCNSVIIDYPASNINSGVATLAATYEKPLFVSDKKLRSDLRCLYNVVSSPCIKFPKVENYVARRVSISFVGERLIKILERRF